MIALFRERIRTELEFHHLAGGPFTAFDMIGARPAYVDHSPFPFHPPFGSSIRPSRPLAWKPMGYGTRSVMNFPSTRPSSELTNCRLRRAHLCRDRRCRTDPPRSGSSTELRQARSSLQTGVPGTGTVSTLPDSVGRWLSVRSAGLGISCDRSLQGGHWRGESRPRLCGRCPRRADRNR